MLIILTKKTWLLLVFRDVQETNDLPMSFYSFGQSMKFKTGTNEIDNETY